MKQFGQLKNGMGWKRIIIGYLIIQLTSAYTTSEHPSDRILGTWISSQRNVIVEIFKEIGTYRGRVLWFDDSDDKSSPMNSRKDRYNPNPALREQKVIGLVVLKNLMYNSRYNRWEHGKIYDVQSGKEWDSSVWLTKDGLLKVKGYWHFELFGKTMTFKRT